MRILLTGGTGFVGGALAAEMAFGGLLPVSLFLVRAAGAEEGCRRIRESLLRFGVTPAVAALVTPGQIICGDLTGVQAFAAHPAL